MPVHAKQVKFVCVCVRTCMWAHLEHGLLVLAVLDMGRGEVEDGSLHAVSLCIVDIDVRTSHHHITLHPAVGIRLQEMQVTLL